MEPRYSRRAVVQYGIVAAGLTLLRPLAARAADVRFASTPFTLGVASGYPEPNAVVLWTRLAPEPLVPGGGVPAAPVPVDWEVATDERCTRVVRSGTAYAVPELAHSVHVEVTGLEPARDYWYRFTSGGERSPIGRTRTAPERGTLGRFRLAVACCQFYEFGHYAAYRAIAASGVDLVVHLGDYIYEQRGVSRVRAHDAPECHSLDDYRHRHALYRLDPHLQAAHAASPWMACFDDHDVANDYAGDRSADDAPRELFLARRAAAYQAYYEHLPLPRRMLPSGPWQMIYTQRTFGDLASLFMLDGRQFRSPHACGPDLPIAPCAELGDERRTMLGETQEQWLERGLAASRSRWNLLGQQTMLSHLDRGGAEGRRYSADDWNGYPAARDRLVRALAEPRVANPVVLSGDIHAFLVSDVHARADDADSPIVATELVCTSISSPARPQPDFDAWRPKNPNVRLARSDFRGYLAIDVDAERLHADLVAVDDVARPDSSTHVLAAFDVESGTAGVAP